jgi:hypothetical protein
MFEIALGNRAFKFEKSFLAWKIGTIGMPYCFENVDVSSFVFNVLYLEMECKEL